MAQQLKPAVRAAILEAAEAVFAEAGYSGATMAHIAQEAGVSTGNLYRYFANKDDLFYTVFTAELAESFLRIVRRRVRSLVEAEDLRDLNASAQQDAQKLLGFWVEHRLKVVTILDRAEGSRYETFADRFIDELMKPSLAKLRRDANVEQLPPVVRFTLHNIFKNTVLTIVSILERHENEAAIREAFAAFWSYQLAGLTGLQAWVKS